jgi:hypothetical protein
MRAAPAGVNSAGKKGCEATESDYGPRFQFTAGLRRLARILLTMGFPRFDGQALGAKKELNHDSKETVWGNAPAV